MSRELSIAERVSSVEQSVTIGGIFKLGVAGVDDTAVYLNIRAARVLLDLPEGLSRYELKLDDLQLARTAAADITARTGLKATAWQDQNAQLLEGLTAQASSGNLIKAFALITIIIGVASALLLSTYRRQSEIGIMRAMGASRGFVVLVFVEWFLGPHHHEIDLFPLGQCHLARDVLGGDVDAFGNLGNAGIAGSAV